VAEEPWAQACACAEGAEEFGGEGHGLACWERGFDGGQKGRGQAVAVVEVWDVGCEACGCVLVCEEADVGEGPAEGSEVLLVGGRFCKE